MHFYRNIHCFIAISLCLLASTGQAKTLQVASLNPLATDILEQVGGADIEIIEVVKADAVFDPHVFRPSPTDIRKMESCKLVVAMGKDLEPYLAGLRDALSSNQIIFEIGDSIPSQHVSEDPVYAGAHQHEHGTTDPHWWHNVGYMERAVKFLARELSKADPAHAAGYARRARETGARMRTLHNWVKSEVSRIPAEQRKLVTAHAAFGYFCKEYGFEAAYIQGLSKESEISSRLLADTIRDLKAKQIRAVFPEKNANPKILAQIAREAGCIIGESLDASGSSGSYEIMIRQNVTRIVQALTDSKKETSGYHAPDGTTDEETMNRLLDYSGITNIVIDDQLTNLKRIIIAGERYNLTLPVNWGRGILPRHFGDLQGQDAPAPTFPCHRSSVPTTRVIAQGQDAPANYGKHPDSRQEQDAPAPTFRC